MDLIKWRIYSTRQISILSTIHYVQERECVLKCSKINSSRKRYKEEYNTFCRRSQGVLWKLWNIVNVKVYNDRSQTYFRILLFRTLLERWNSSLKLSIHNKERLLETTITTKVNLKESFKVWWNRLMHTLSEQMGCCVISSK